MNAEIAIGFCPVGEDGRYRGRISTLIDPGPFQHLPRREAVLQLTQRLTLELEKGIRQEPASWLWSYKRWKYIPANGDPGDFPYYARRLAATSGSPGE
jgi:lauroyl/myristoyl acyltransferase